jgi:hypothetical protein
MNQRHPALSFEILSVVNCPLSVERPPLSSLSTGNWQIANLEGEISCLKLLKV